MASSLLLLVQQIRCCREKETKKESFRFQNCFTGLSWLGLCHSTPTPAGTPRLGLCHNTNDTRSRKNTNGSHTSFSETDWSVDCFYIPLFNAVNIMAATLQTQRRTDQLTDCFYSPLFNALASIFAYFSPLNSMIYTYPLLSSWSKVFVHNGGAMLSGWHVQIHRTFSLASLPEGTAEKKRKKNLCKSENNLF